MMLRKLESAMRRRIRERYDQTRTWDRRRIDKFWDLILFSRSKSEQRLKTLTLYSGNTTLSFDELKGFGYCNIFDKEHLNRIIDFAKTERAKVMQGSVQKSNSKEYLQQIFDLSKVTDESLFFLEGVLTTEVIDAVSRYFGKKLPLLHEASIFYSPKSNKQSVGWEGSQLYHRDGEGTRNLKIWVLCDETNMENGPTVLLDAEHSESIAREIDYLPGAKLEDAQVENSSRFRTAERFFAVGKSGTVFYTDTCRSFHYGSRTSSSASRLVAMYHFVDNNCSYYLPYVGRTFRSRLKPLSSHVKEWVKDKPHAQAILSRRLEI